MSVERVRSQHRVSRYAGPVAQADLRLEVGAWSRRGRLWRVNADSWCSHVPADPRWLSSKGAFFAVADSPAGSGRHPASRKAVGSALQSFYSCSSECSGFVAVLHAAGQPKRGGICHGGVGFWPSSVQLIDDGQCKAG
jgi:hypothetical protein